MNKVHDLALSLLKSDKHFEKATFLGCYPVTGDASGRQYYRLSLDHVSHKNVILMILAGGTGPVGGGSRKLSQDDTYVEVARYFRKHAIRVPEILVDARDQGALLVEDVGSDSLLNLTQQLKNNSAEIFTLYKKTLEILKSMQNLQSEPANVVFERSTTADQRRTQILEFLDYYAVPLGLSESHAKTVKEFLLEICNAISKHPQVVSHFDFMASNIHVLANQEICLIDFQDACLDSPMRDLYALLNDRGSDQILGREQQFNLIKHYITHCSKWDNFQQMYNQYALHWDFRVCGRFEFLAQKPGMTRYQAWIPGTLRRIGRTLARSSEPGSEEILRILSEFSSEIKTGSEELWPLPIVV